ncbi:Glycolipid 2-alpha-mannosyltransferase 1 [Chlorella vulgaris]
MVEFGLRGPAPRSGALLLLSGALTACLVLCLHLTRSSGGAQGERVGPRRLGPVDDLADARALLAAWPEDKPRACILILARNSDLDGVLRSVKQLERRFNAQPSAQYPYCYLNDEPFSNEFRAVAAAATVAPAFFGLVPAAHWSYPPHINTTLAAELRSAARRRMPYGGSESYRFMCRYFSGFFFDHPLLEGFEWYWRVEPEVHFMCDLPGISHDPFRHMQANNQSLAWTIVMEEVPSTIPSLWPTMQRWLAANPHHVVAGNMLPAILEDSDAAQIGDEAAAVDDRGDAAGYDSRHALPLLRPQRQLYSSPRFKFTGCHFWSNFEVGRLAFFRSAGYRSFFQHLDSDTGFFYERWGDAPVHTLAAAALLTPEQVYFARDIGYKHGSWSYCPSQPADRPRCDCHPAWDAVPLAQPRCQLDFQTRLHALQRAEE